MKIKIVAYSSLFGCLFLIFACNNKRVSIQETASLNYCQNIDTIILNHEQKVSNQYMTDNLSLLVIKTGIPDHSIKNILGCTYENDNIFYSDMHKYRVGLGCSDN